MVEASLESELDQPGGALVEVNDLEIESIAADIRASLALLRRHL